MRTRSVLGIVLLAFWASAHSDEAFETIEHSCDINKKQFQLHYQVFWNTQGPSGPDFTSVAGESSSHTCMIDGIPIRTDLVLHTQSGQGMCGGVPGGFVNSLKFGEMEILHNMPLNSCYSSWLDRVVVRLQKDDIEITFCGSHHRKGKGEQAGCFVERYKKSQLPKQLYSNGKFPFAKYEPNTRFEADAVR